MQTTEVLLPTLSSSTGALMGGCGDKSIRFRPALVAKEYHIQILLNVLNDVLAQIK